MSQNSIICESFLKSEDDDFVLKVDNDIRYFFTSDLKNSVLLFPAVNSYRRFLIHKVCDTISNDTSSNGSLKLATFSIGVEENRRTVVCYKNQLLIETNSSQTKSLKEVEFSWNYFKRNSVPKYNTSSYDRYGKTRENRSNRIMGIEKIIDCASTSQRTISEEGVGNCFKTESNLLLEETLTTKKISRTRRPDRQVYVPRAKRSQTTPPSSVPSKSHNKKSEKSKSIDENTIAALSSLSSSSGTSTNSEEANDKDSSPLRNQFSDGAVINSLEFNINTQSSTSCDFFNTTCHQKTDSIVNSDKPSTNQKNKKNLDNICTMSQKEDKELIIENAENSANNEKFDKDEKELIKASQEINRSNRKLIKQTFNSNILEIETASALDESKSSEEKTVSNDDDDWDTLFDDNGDCLDPKMVEELTKAVGKVNIEKPKSDYKAYHSNVDLLREETYPHVLECSNFPVEFRTQDLMALFAPFAKESGFNVIWVDDTHCLVVFSSSKIAAEVLTASHPIVRMKPLGEATAESRTKARKCSSSLQPYRQRPETCAALAKRLVSGALGVRIKATSEERENERRVLREAKERKLLAAKAREEMWNN